MVATVAEVEIAVKRLAEGFGYHFWTMTDGTIVLEPPSDPGCCAMCAAVASKE